MACKRSSSRRKPNKSVQQQQQQRDQVQRTEKLMVKRTEGAFQSRRGTELFTCSWVPTPSDDESEPSPCKALVFLCHGYGMECSIFMSKTGERLARAGYSVFGLDYEGHGKSSGKRCYIHRFEDIVDDCSDFFTAVRSRPEFGGKPAFLYGESMGGAVALLLERRSQQHRWNGAVLLAPMCKISENMLPRPWLRWLLIKLSCLIPTWKIVPTKDVIDQSFKDEKKREAIRGNPYIYTGRMILKTAVELLLTSLSLEKVLDEVRLPFIVLHGEADLVTDPAISRELYAAAGSSDKTIKIYSGMWHGLTTGEPDRNVDLVFRDITEWLDKRCSPLLDSASDGLKKLEEDSFEARQQKSNAFVPLCQVMETESQCATSVTASIHKHRLLCCPWKS